MNNKTIKELISEQQIAQRVKEIADQISTDYSDKGELVLIGILKGAFIFLADLSRQLTIPRQIEFIAVSSYEKKDNSGAVRLVMDARGNLEGKHILIVEDILDTGNTMKYLLHMLTSRNPASIATCCFLHKPNSLKVDMEINYIGFEIEDEWVVGYGLDFNEENRTLPYVGIIDT